MPRFLFDDLARFRRAILGVGSLLPNGSRHIITSHGVDGRRPEDLYIRKYTEIDA